MKRSISLGLRVLLAIAAGGLVTLAQGDAWAQNKQEYSFKQPPDAVAKYTQQLAIDVGDVPGHQVRVLETHTTYAGAAPVYGGVKVKEGWLRGMSDYVDANGHITGYTVAFLENGDKIFGRYEGITKTTIGADGAKTTQTDGVTTLTGGTGKFKGIRGTLKSKASTDFKTTSGGITEGEYWIEN